MPLKIEFTQMPDYDDDIVCDFKPETFRVEYVRADPTAVPGLREYQIGDFVSIRRIWRGVQRAAVVVSHDRRYVWSKGTHYRAYTQRSPGTLVEIKSFYTVFMLDTLQYAKYQRSGHMEHLQDWEVKRQKEYYLEGIRNGTIGLEVRFRSRRARYEKGLQDCCASRSRQGVAKGDRCKSCVYHILTEHPLSETEDVAYTTGTC